MILSFATTMRTQESQSLGLPDFPLDNLPAIAKILVSPNFACFEQEACKKSCISNMATRRPSWKIN
jgi:hypothetical protein